MSWPSSTTPGRVHNFLTSEGTPPAELLAAGRAEVAGYGVRVLSATATSARRLAGEAADAPGRARFQVDLADGRAVRARRLVVTTGLVDELPELDGLAERWGRDVLHCPYCHGWEVRDQAIGVLATGPTAVHQALLFRQLSADVVLFQHTGPALSAAQAEQLAARQIPVVDGEVAAVVVRDDRLTGVRLRSGRVVARQALVVAPRFTARAGVLAGLGLATSELVVDGHVLGSHVPADATGATSVAGVWVAGNVADPMAQVVMAAAAGLRAGAAVNGDLVNEDTAGAVAAHRALTEAELFSARAEAEVCEQVVGARRHGV